MGSPRLTSSNFCMTDGMVKAWAATARPSLMPLTILWVTWQRNTSTNKEVTLPMISKISWAFQSALLCQFFPMLSTKLILKYSCGFCMKWYETFASWLVETKWSRIGYIPSMHEYLDTGMISIATHTLVLPASCFLNPNLPKCKLKPSQYETITKLLMVIARLLNDIQSHQVMN